MKSIIVIIASTIAFSACSKPEQASETADVATSTVAAVSDLATVYQAAVSNPARSDADRLRDASRKPDQILEFFGIEPGMHVLDMFSGGGFYTELVSYVVGPEGHVTSHSNEPYAQFVGNEAVTRYSNDRLPNISILMAENNELQLDANSYDAVLLMLSFHDIYHVDVKNGWEKIDGPLFLAELYKGMKPGAVMGIVDHHAEAGSPRETGNTLHRIDPAIVISDMEAAGFVADGSSNVLRNVDDDYSVNMFDAAVRGKTDRFVMRFVRPE